MNKQSLQYTAIFGGGAIRGISYVGAYKAMEELGIFPTTIAGSSVGAIFSGLVAVGYNAEELREIFMKVNFELFRDIHFGFGKDFALSKGEVFLDWVRELIEQRFYGDAYKKGENPAVTFKDLEKNLVIITTDLTNFKYKEFSRYETPDYEIAMAIRISSGMPGLMKPMLYNNAMLVDGDLQKSWPLWRLSENLCRDDERVLEFRLEGDYEGKGSNAIDFINTVYSCITSVATSFIIEQYGQRDKFDYIVINTGAVVVVDFNQPKEKRVHLMQIGYEQTMNYFKTILPFKKENLTKDYSIVLKYLKQIEKYIEANKIQKAQSELGHLFMELADLKRNIDKTDYKKIRNFKNKFLQNIKPPSLFGAFTLKHHTELEQELHCITSEIEEKYNELSDYARG